MAKKTPGKYHVCDVLEVDLRAMQLTNLDEDRDKHEYKISYLVIVTFANPNGGESIEDSIEFTKLDEAVTYLKSFIRSDGYDHRQVLVIEGVTSMCIHSAIVEDSNIRNLKPKK